MAQLPKIRTVVALIVAACLTCPPALALVTFDDSKDHIFVTGTASVAYDSNIFAHAGGGGDTLYSEGFLVEYTRRAGWIGVNASAGLDLSQFAKNPSENSTDPRFSLELNKTTGRTTGAFNLSAARENRADSAANIREQSWNYAAGLTFKYPVIDRYSISGNLGYTSQIFDQSSGLSNLSTYTAGSDLLYAFTDERDLLAGYRYRYSETSYNTAYDDHSFTAGVSGKIISSLNGSLRAGYEVRRPHGNTVDGGYQGLTAAGSVTWALTRKFTLTGQLSRDVSVSANAISMETLSGSVDAQYVFNAKLSVFANIGGGQNRFLGAAGDNRRDQFFTFGGGINYTILPHLKAELAYMFFENWSTLSYSTYDHNTVTLSLSSRW